MHRNKLKCILQHIVHRTLSETIYNSSAARLPSGKIRFTDNKACSAIYSDEQRRYRLR